MSMVYKRLLVKTTHSFLFQSIDGKTQYIRYRPGMAHIAYVGIDPGAKGGVGTITVDKTGAMTATACQMPMLDGGVDGRTLASLFYAIVAAHSTVVVALEQVGAMPGQGVTSMFTFGKGYGKIQGVLEALSVSYRLVAPVRWKRALDVMQTGKEGTVALVLRAFPDLQLIPPRCRVPHDGMSDGVAIALWAKHNAEHPIPDKRVRKVKRALTTVNTP